MPPIPTAPMGVSWKNSEPMKQVNVELFLDFLCPFCKKMWNVLWNEVMPTYKDETNVDFVVQNVVQPWHPQNTLLHEVTLAARALSERAFFACANALYAKQEEFSDEKLWDKSRQQIYDLMVEIVAPNVAEVLCKPEDVVREELLKKLAIDAPERMLPMKLAAKYHRTNGVHVTPTVFINGLDADIGSSWTKEQWEAKISALLL